MAMTTLRTLTDFIVVVLLSVLLIASLDVDVASSSDDVQSPSSNNSNNNSSSSTIHSSPSVQLSPTTLPKVSSQRNNKTQPKVTNQKKSSRQSKTQATHKPMAQPLPHLAGAQLPPPQQIYTVRGSEQNEIPEHDEEDEEEDIPLRDIVFALDTSSNVTSDDLEIMKEFVLGLLRGKHVNSGVLRVGLMTFESKPLVRFHLSKYKKMGPMERMFRSEMKVQGQRNLASALRMVREIMFQEENGDRPDAENVLVLLTGGASALETQYTISQAEENDRANIRTLVISVGNDKTAALEQQRIANYPNHLFIAPDFSRLRNPATREILRRRMLSLPALEIPETTTTSTTTPTPPSTTQPTTTSTTTTTTTKTLTTMPATTVVATTRDRKTTSRTSSYQKIPRHYHYGRYIDIYHYLTKSSVHNFTDCKGSADVVFLLDSSASIGEESYDRIVRFLVDVTSRLDINSDRFRVALVIFSDDASTVFHFRNRSHVETLSKLSSVPYLNGATNTYAGLREVRTKVLTSEFNRPHVQDIVILITDGLSNINHERTLPEARRLKKTGAIITGIAVNLQNRAELLDIVSEPANNLALIADSIPYLDRQGNGLADKICQNTDACLANPCQNGGRCKSHLNEYFCSCASGFTRRDCSTKCSGKLDIIFALEVSGFVGEANLNLMKTFVKDVLEDVSISACSIRVGLIKYGSSAFIHFHLDDYTTLEDILNKIDEAQFSHGSCFLADAIHKAHSSMFSASHGASADARKILILIGRGNVDVKPKLVMSEVRKARNALIHIITVAVQPDEEGRQLMARIATEPSGAFELDSFALLYSLHESLIQHVFDASSQCHPNPCENGATCIDLLNHYRCECAAGFSGRNCRKSCRASSDIVFVVDTTRSMKGRDFSQIKDLLYDFVQQLPIDHDQVRVGLMKLGRPPFVNRYLNEPGGKVDILGAIEALNYDGGDPLTPEFLEAMVEDVFTEAKGDRPHARNYVIILTGGKMWDVGMTNMAKQPRHNGIHVFGVGLNLREREKNQLRELVENRETDIYLPNTREQLLTSLNKIFTSICEDDDQCAISNPCKNGGKCVDGLDRFACKCAPGYVSRDCSKHCPGPIDLAFLLDASIEMGQQNFYLALNFASELVEQVNLGFNRTRVAAMSYSDRTRAVFYLDSIFNSSQASDAIHGTTFRSGFPDLSDAFSTVRRGIFTERHGERANAKNVLIFITASSGSFGSSDDSIAKSAHQLKNDTNSLVISVGPYVDKVSLFRDLSGVGNFYAVAKDFSDIKNHIPIILESICDDGDSCEVNPCQNGGTCVDDLRFFTCYCPDGFTGDRCEIGFERDLDVVFAIDTSRSVGYYNFHLLKDFVSSVVERLPISSGKAKVAMITYSDHAETRFFFNTYKNAHSIVNRIETLSYYGHGASDHVSALMEARQRIFRQLRGARDDAQDVVILITDGPYGALNKTHVEESRRLEEAGIRVITLALFFYEEETLLKAKQAYKDAFDPTSMSTLSPNSYYNFFYQVNAKDKDQLHRHVLPFSSQSSDVIFLTAYHQLNDRIADLVVAKLRDVYATLPPVTPKDERPPISFNLYDFLRPETSALPKTKSSPSPKRPPKVKVTSPVLTVTSTVTTPTTTFPITVPSTTTTTSTTTSTTTTTTTTTTLPPPTSTPTPPKVETPIKTSTAKNGKKTKKPKVTTPTTTTSTTPVPTTTTEPLPPTAVMIPGIDMSLWSGKVRKSVLYKHDQCMRPMDLVLGIAVPQHLKQKDFKKFILEGFFVTFMSKFRVGERQVKVSAFAFDDEGEITMLFDFDQFQSTKELISKGLKKIKLYKHRPILPKAIDYLENRAFLPEHGARSGVFRAVTVVTGPIEKSTSDVIVEQLDRMDLSGIPILLVSYGGMSSELSQQYPLNTIQDYLAVAPSLAEYICSFDLEIDESDEGVDDLVSYVDYDEEIEEEDGDVEEDEDDDLEFGDVEV